MEYESVSDSNCNWYAWYSNQRFGTWTRGLENKRTSGDHPNYSIIEIAQNTKSPVDVGRLVVTQTPVKDYQQTLVWKTHKKENNDYNNNCVDTPVEELEDNMKKSKERLISATSISIGNKEKNKTKKKKKKIENQLYRYFKRQTDKIVYEKTWVWLSKVKLDRETEA